jgi:hypothetical protein
LTNIILRKAKGEGCPSGLPAIVEDDGWVALGEVGQSHINYPWQVNFLNELLFIAAIAL